MPARAFRPGLLACAALLLAAATCGGGCASTSPKPTAPTGNDIQPLAHRDETISVDFPDEQIADIIANVARLYRLDVRLPANVLPGRTSIKLRDVTWRQIFRVTLSPVGYDFYEHQGVVHILTKEELDALPWETATITLHHQSPEELARFMAGLYPRNAQFSSTPIPGDLSYQAHPKYASQIAAEIVRWDSPDINLNPFPNPVYFPATIPELPLSLNRVVYLNGAPGPGEDPLSTQVLILEKVSASAVADYLQNRKHIVSPSRVLPDLRVNALIVTAPESRMPRLEAIVRHLDDPRWYQKPTTD